MAFRAPASISSVPLPSSCCTDFSHPQPSHGLSYVTASTHTDSLSPFCPTLHRSFFRPQLKRPFSSPPLPLPHTPAVTVTVSTFMIILCVITHLNSSSSLRTGNVLVQHNIPSVRHNGSLGESWALEGNVTVGTHLVPGTQQACS